MLKLSISNIAWAYEKDEEVYLKMAESGFTGLEIAPTRLYPELPYDRAEEAGEWSKMLRERYDLNVSSMQSIWFGRNERLFGPEQERASLLDYTKKAIDFAVAIGCKNLVFGCPKNRMRPDCANESVAEGFFRELGNYAFLKGTCIGLEANPTIYGTNYINDTASAIALIKKVNSPGFKLNLDFGTIIYNEESLKELYGEVGTINHVHISEPNLLPIRHRDKHRELRRVLEDEGYSGFISIEMGRTEDYSLVEDAMKYIGEVFA